MRYRRNADRNIRDLERQAEQGDPEAAQKLLRAELRAGNLSKDVANALPCISPQVAYSYLRLARFLQEQGIPYSLEPSNVRCMCENTDCGLHERLADRCTDYMKCGFDSVVNGVCQNEECQYDGEVQYDLDECQNLGCSAWIDMLGGLCEACAELYPLRYHTNICNCKQCGSGLGPLFQLRSQIIDGFLLSQLQNFFRVAIDHERTEAVIRSFPSSLNISIKTEQERLQTAQQYGWPHQSVLEQLREADYNNNSSILERPRLDTYGVIFIQVLAEGGYRLRVAGHLSINQLISYQYLEDNRAISQMLEQYSDETLQQAANLLAIHYYGRDVRWQKLQQILLAKRPLKMDAVAKEFKGLMHQAGLRFISHPKINPFNLVAIIPAKLDLHNVTMQITRHADYDMAQFAIETHPGNYSTIYGVLTRDDFYNHPRKTSPDSILRSLYEELNQ